MRHPETLQLNPFMSVSSHLAPNHSPCPRMCLILSCSATQIMPLQRAILWLTYNLRRRQTDRLLQPATATQLQHHGQRSQLQSNLALTFLSHTMRLLSKLKRVLIFGDIFCRSMASSVCSLVVVVVVVQ